MKIEGDWVYFSQEEAAPFEPKQQGDEYFLVHWTAYYSDYYHRDNKWFKNDDDRGEDHTDPDGYNYRRPVRLTREEILQPHGESLHFL